MLAKRFGYELEAVLRCTLITINESTDISTKKQLTIVVRFFCERENKIKGHFFKLLKVAAGDATTLISCITSLFEKEKIPLDNMIGYALDTTYVIFEQHHSVISLLEDRLPNLMVMKYL